MGMKNQAAVGYRVFKKIQVQTLPENTCITSKLIHRHKGLEYVSTTTPNFLWLQNFSAFFSCLSVSNQSMLSLRLASTTADLIPYPFGSGIEEQIPFLPGRIQVLLPVPVPALTLMPRAYTYL